MKIKIITDSEELEQFTSREDIIISKIDVRSCEQTFFAQQWFVAVVMYEENTCDNFDWQSFRAEAAKTFVRVLIPIIDYENTSDENIIKNAINLSDELIKQLKEKEGQQ